MVRSGPELSYPSLLLGGLTVGLGIALVVAASTSGAAFGVYNPTWDGASDLRGVADDMDAENEIALNTTAYRRASSNGTIAFVLSPDRGYDQGDKDRLVSFVRNGGTLVVAEDYGSTGNSLLDALDVTTRFDGRPVRDERYNYRSPAIPVARNVSNHTLTRNVSRLTMNHGTALQPNNATVLVSTSEFAYLDRNGNGELDDDESLQQRPIVTVESVGAGQVIAVSDPSLFINAMLDRSGNRQFTENLLERHERVLLDYSHAGQQPPLTVALLTLRGSPLFQILGGILGVCAIALWARRPEGWLEFHRAKTADDRRDPADRSFDEEAIVGHLRRQHPEWDESRIRRVMRGVFTDDRQDSDDE
ncbi:DUF4350 domain-containing protein [Halobium palmae]|uniref:DUF4350 domain-containing protein n=1 Tax=Halobium palmae TaxID=1776492 RepID=A0ABD5RVP7_9EURY